MLVHDLAFIKDPRFHGPQGSLTLRRRFEKALPKTDFILYPSLATRADLSHHYPQALRDIPSSLLTFGLDHVPIPPTPLVQKARTKAAELLGTTEPYLVILGTLEPRKNHDSLLTALHLLASRGTPIPLLVIGAPGWLSHDLQANLQRQTQNHNPKNKGQLPFPLAWTGSLPDAEVFPLLAGAAGLVYPSSLEGFGFPPLEALILGTPVLAGDCPALQETLQGQPGALFAEGRDPVALAAKIPLLMKTLTGPCKDLRQQTWDKTARFILSLDDS
jgi:glycosyltransferase involved in cell wall biosynthesis